MQVSRPMHQTRLRRGGRITSSYGSDAGRRLPDLWAGRRWAMLTLRQERLNLHQARERVEDVLFAAVAFDSAVTVLAAGLDDAGVVHVVEVRQQAAAASVPLPLRGGLCA